MATTNTASIYRSKDPILTSVEYGAVYRICAPRTGDPWVLYKTADACGVVSIEPLDIPDGWDDSYEYPIGYVNIWRSITRLAMEAYLAHATLEVAFVRVIDEDADDASYALLHRFVWPN